MSVRRVRVDVVLADRRVGELVFESDGRRQSSMFRYADTWLGDKTAFALSPSMPLVDAPFFSSGRESGLALPDPVADAAPDSWGRSLLDAALGRRADEIDYLLLSDDATRQGALRFRDESGAWLSLESPSLARLIDLPRLRHLAHAWESKSPMDRELIAQLQGYSGPLGGARPKANMDDNGVLSIVKFTSRHDNVQVERAEVATLKLAARAGLSAPSARLELMETDRPVAVIARFDRNGPQRAPYISAHSFMGREAPDPVYYTDMVDMMVAHGANLKQELHELYRRILFSILVSNNDNHLKNHGFLYAGNNLWRQSPVFDINPQPERHPHLKTGISELSGSEASIEAAIEAAPFFDLETDAAVSTLSGMLMTVERDWRALFLEAGMNQDEVSYYKPAFDHEETRIARRSCRAVIPAGRTKDRAGAAQDIAEDAGADSGERQEQQAGTPKL